MTLLVSGAAVAQVKVLHSFNGSNGDGFDPIAGLVSDASGNLYGTTFYGGTEGNGSVYRLTRTASDWTETLLYSFQNIADGYWVTAPLVLDRAGNLYGAAQFGGVVGYGIVFELTPGTGSWKEKILYNFHATDGSQPHAGLIFDAAGNLYGTTAGGGTYSDGTVFELTPNGDGTWTEKTLHEFGGTPTDGAGPLGGLVMDVSGTLYGTTTSGGGTSSRCLQGCGTAFQLKPNGDGTWEETVLHSFTTGKKDGHFPSASLILDAAGNLYGTTGSGGSKGDYGTVFELIPAGDGNWTEKVLHNFNNDGRDGFNPSGSLVFDASGNLFSTTLGGGTDGQGTVFALTPRGDGTWKEKILHNFHQDPRDGYNPVAGVIFGADANLYGTTGFGGSNDSGTVYEIAH